MAAAISVKPASQKIEESVSMKVKITVKRSSAKTRNEVLKVYLNNAFQN